MNNLPERLREEIDRLASAPLPAERPGLRDELLRQFDHEFARSSGRRRWPVLLNSIAAAALIVVSLWLGSSVPKGPELTPGDRRDLAIMMARLDRLERAIEELEVTTQKPVLATVTDRGEARFSRVHGLVHNDPALLRLASARAFEPIDSAQATRRYRELLEQYDRGPAAAVARARLAFLENPHDNGDPR